MVGKLKRLPDATQERIKQLACLGNVAEIATLSLKNSPKLRRYIVNAPSRTSPNSIGRKSLIRHSLLLRVGGKMRM